MTGGLVLTHFSQRHRCLHNFCHVQNIPNVGHLCLTVVPQSISYAVLRSLLFLPTYFHTYAHSIPNAINGVRVFCLFFSERGGGGCDRLTISYLFFSVLPSISKIVEDFCFLALIKLTHEYHLPKAIST